MKYPMLHPHFVIKHYLFQDIHALVTKYCFQGSIIDVGCGEKPYRQLFSESTEYIGIDFKNYSHNNLSTNLAPDRFFSKDYLKTFRLPYKTALFSHAVSFQVAEHHKNPQKHIQELTRVTQKGGYILLSVPFIWGLHEIPNDYYRFTEYALKVLFEENNCRVITIKKQGAICSTLSMLAIDYLIEASHYNILTKVLCYILSAVLIPLSLTTIILDRLFPSQAIYLNAIVLAKKL